MAVKRLNGEGSIRKKVVKDKVYWEGRYTDENGKQRSVSGKTQSELRDKLKKIMADLEQRKKEQEAQQQGREYYNENMTLNEWYDIYMKRFAGDIKPQTRTIYNGNYRKTFKDSIGNEVLRNITEEMILDLIQDLKSKGYAGSTINAKIILLKKLFKKAAEKQILQRNILNQIKLKHSTPRLQKREITTEEIELFLKLLSEKRKHLYPLVEFLLHTGCRINEAVALTWGDVSKDFKFCNINKTTAVYKDESINKLISYDSTPKNTTSVRKIPLDSETQQVLIELSALRKQQGVYGDNKNVFLGKRLGKLQYSSVYNMFKKISAIIQTNYDPNFPDISPHWFRHTFTSRGINKNVPLLYLQKIGGWKNLQMISQIYGHMSDEQALQAVSVIYEQ